MLINTLPLPDIYSAPLTVMSHMLTMTASSAPIGIAKQASQLTMYDVKSYYNQAKNMVLNVSEMEAKVREATNDDPWYVSISSPATVSLSTEYEHDS